jgi:alkyldihydroxyacetonephosphate synthase
MRLADRGLRLLRYAEGRCLLLLGVTGRADTLKRDRREALAIIRANGGLHAGSLPGKTWRKSRFRTPYLRNTLWEMGYAVDTLETALPWSGVPLTAARLKQAIADSLAASGEKVLVFAHLSHVYEEGASIYVTYLFRRAADPDETLHRWLALKAAASQVLVEQRATISHQHGVGLDHAPYLAAEKGAIGLAMLEGVRQTLDPQGLLNPGKLLPGSRAANGLPGPPYGGAGRDEAASNLPESG